MYNAFIVQGSIAHGVVSKTLQFDTLEEAHAYADRALTIYEEFGITINGGPDKNYIESYGRCNGKLYRM